MSWMADVLLATVSIPQAVIGCMQFLRYGKGLECNKVSIPQAVIGCMQYHTRINTFAHEAFQYRKR